MNSLKTAAMSGVDVRLLLPHKSDSWLTHWCTRSYVEELLEAGVKIYWYQKGINHSKVIIVDGSVASVGTANMDLRSFEQNFEVSLIIYDREVVKKLAVDFMKDLKVSTEGAIQRWKFRTKREKCVNRWRVCLHRYFKKVKGYKYKWEGGKEEILYVQSE